MGVRYRLLLLALPRTALDRCAAFRRAFRCVRFCVLIDGPGAVSVPSDDQQPLAPRVQAVNPKDARTQPEIAILDRGHHRESVDTRNRSVLPITETRTSARLRTSDGPGANPGARIIAHWGDLSSSVVNVKCLFSHQRRHTLSELSFIIVIPSC